jgi:ribonuclease J
MRVRIHRGAKEIGGTCIEVEAQGKRMVLDVGRPLDAEPGEVVPLPDVAGIADGSDLNLVGLLISHGHQDHWGLIDQVSPKVSVYIGEGAANILREAKFFSRAGIDLAPAGYLRHRQQLYVGPFQLTPFLNDHNGFDTYSVLVEADGKRLFYSADFQGHGRKSAIFKEMLRRPPRDVDVMLMEGTNVREDDDGTTHPEVSEREVELAIARQASKSQGMTLVTYSSQNIDRLVTLYRVAKRTGKKLVVDLYTATMAAATERESIPTPGWDHLLVFVPNLQRIRIAKTNAFERLEPIKPFRIFPEALRARRTELIMTFRMSMARELERADCLDGASAVWSMWPGYLQRPAEQPYPDFLQRHGIQLEIHHASGHAYLDDLKRLAEAVSPKRLVPIHSYASDRFGEHFRNVEPHDDGIWWDV